MKPAPPVMRTRMRRQANRRPALRLRARRAAREDERRVVQARITALLAREVLAQEHIEVCEMAIDVLAGKPDRVPDIVRMERHVGVVAQVLAEDEDAAGPQQAEGPL